MNAAAPSLHHAGATSKPLSRLFTFLAYSDEVLVRCYLHTDRFAPQGWHEPAEHLLGWGKACRSE